MLRRPCPEPVEGRSGSAANGTYCSAPSGTINQTLAGEAIGKRRENQLADLIERAAQLHLELAFVSGAREPVKAASGRVDARTSPRIDSTIASAASSRSRARAASP